MSAAKVDVLAVLDAVGEWAREVSDEYLDGAEGMRSQYAQDLRDGRDAERLVGELIQAGSRVTAAFRANGSRSNGGFDPKLHQECEAAVVSLDRVLARIGGEP
jgi:hypothetical protein